MITRTDLLNHLAEKYQLKRYLEIGVQNPIQNFDKIKCEWKVSVDPDPNAHATFCMTSDEFFNSWSRRPGEFICTVSENEFDLVFIDGLHTAEQVQKDFENALKILSPNGFIVLHDCNPLKEEHTIVPRPTPVGHWHGDVYRFAVQVAIGNTSWFNVVDIDCGCGVFNRSGSFCFKDSLNPTIYNFEDTWDYFNKNRKELLNLISWDEFISIGSHV